MITDEANFIISILRDKHSEWIEMQPEHEWQILANSLAGNLAKALTENEFYKKMLEESVK